VPEETVAALAREGEAVGGGSWRFCATPECEVVWFDEASERRVGRGGVRVPVFPKEAGPERLVCYCFGFRVADVLAAEAGVVARDIAGRCRRGEHRCGQTNPQGACCLGNVRALVA
jgi:hypothetical protein